jgi:hypothetical protein
MLIRGDQSAEVCKRGDSRHMPAHAMEEDGRILMYTKQRSNDTPSSVSALDIARMKWRPDDDNGGVIDTACGEHGFLYRLPMMVTAIRLPSIGYVARCDKLPMVQ